MSSTPCQQPKNEAIEIARAHEDPVNMSISQIHVLLLSECQLALIVYRRCSPTEAEKLPMVLYNAQTMAPFKVESKEPASKISASHIFILETSLKKLVYMPQVQNWSWCFLLPPGGGNLIPHGSR